MTQAEAETVATWTYDEPYSFYDSHADADDLAELVDPGLRGNSYFSAHDENGEVIGFFQFERLDDIVDVGLGLRPDLTGRGLGLAYVESGLAFARKRFSPRRFTLSVATFNQRAITVYERAGFVVARRYMHETNGGIHAFVEMEREV
jgi:[ribosomal protein S18]-alanine N-acetyltransferase